jgi:hypothetical protein
MKSSLEILKINNMKNQLFISLALIILFTACQKRNAAPAPSSPKSIPVIEKHGPYGKESKWLSIGGDTLFTDTLTLSHFYTEIATPCNICYYQQNISFWNDYDYTFAVSECAVATDTLIFTDIDSGRKAIFKHQK